jgi:hypothetical protein
MQRWAALARHNPLALKKLLRGQPAAKALGAAHLSQSQLPPGSGCMCLRDPPARAWVVTSRAPQLQDGECGTGRLSLDTILCAERRRAAARATLKRSTGDDEPMLAANDDANVGQTARLDGH